MYHTTGFSRAEIIDICGRVEEMFSSKQRVTGRKPTLGLFKSIAVTLAYLRRNRVQQELAEYFGTSQSTISRAITTFVPILAAVLGDWTPTVDDLDPTSQYIIDGTLLPCWSWQNKPELYSGKHRTTGVNVQVACTLNGDLAWVSDPQPGSTHDAKAIRESGFLDQPATRREPLRHLGDKGYIGLGMITPKRKPPGLPLPDADKQYNKQVNQIRYLIERTIANLKTWRILHTDYRRPLSTFAETISAVIALEFFRTTF
jgi:DDE superfamily endonuclease/Helix-turn-helix of DDE superfamily endonuclease